MDRISKCFLNSLRCAVRDVPLDPAPELTYPEWDLVFRMAGIHHVLPMVFEAVHALPELREYPPLPAIRRNVFRQVMLQTQKRADFLFLNRALAEAGVKPLVVKGIVCRELYPKPDHRVSSDEDLLIEPARAAVCHDIFSRLGLVTDLDESMRKTAYEIPYRKEGSALYIELHR